MRCKYIYIGKSGRKTKGMNIISKLEVHISIPYQGPAVQSFHFLCPEQMLPRPAVISLGHGSGPSLWQRAVSDHLTTGYLSLQQAYHNPEDIKIVKITNNSLH